MLHDGVRKSGIYIHIPFCISKCFYCDFPSIVLPSADILNTYVNMLIKDLERQKSARGIRENVSFSSIYFGGGTPSLLSVNHLKKILLMLRNNFNLEKDIEITIEVNPGNSADSNDSEFLLDENKILEYRNLNINRVSLGVQSFSDDFLKFLGRRHRLADVYRLYDFLRGVGGIQVNFDLMYGFSGQSVSQWMMELELAVSLEPDHISFYELTVSEKTVFGRKRKKGLLSFPEEEKVACMYEKGVAYLLQNNFVQYEISNFSRPGKECVHNWNYWGNGEYLGVGAAAWSFVSGRRYKNVYPPGKYIRSLMDGDDTIEYCESLSVSETVSESLILGLRRNIGICLDEFRIEWGVSLLELFNLEIEDLREAGLICVSEGRLFLTQSGRLLSNSVFLRFMR